MGNINKKRVGYFDVLNISATLTVVFLHCNGIVHTYSNTNAWKQALIIEVICYWAVPVFFMLSGATLFEYRKRYTTCVFLKKRFYRTVIPFIAWTFINIVIKGINPLANGISGMIGEFCNSTYEGIYWFFLPLFSIYLCIPVFSKLIHDREILWYMVIVGFLFNSLLPAIFKELQISWNGNSNFPLMGGYLLYPVIGYLLSTGYLKRWQRTIIYGIAIFGVLLRYIATYVLSTADGTINKRFFGYNEYYSFFLAIAVFTFVQYSNVVDKISKCNIGRKVLPVLASLSFGVYLMHMIIYRQLEKVLNVNTWQWRLLVPFLIYGICLLLTFIIRKIPVVKMIIP